MKHISVESIERAIDKVDNLDDDNLERIAETYTLAQQELLGYLMSATIEYNNEEALAGLLIYYYCLISEAFAQEQVQLNQITESDIDAFQEPFFQMLDEYFDQEHEDILMDFVDQPDLVTFMMIEISTPDDDGTAMDSETASQLFIVTMAMISLMSRAIR